MKNQTPFRRTSLWRRVPCALLIFSTLLAAGASLPPHASAQALPKHDIERGREMLKIVKEELEENYYDPNFHGMDLKTRFKAADERIKNAKSNGEINSIIAQVLVELNDSHTVFLPPNRAASIDYGWRMQMIGDTCYVVDVKPGSDAEAKGLKVGDVVWSIDGYEPTRENLWKIKYSYYTLKYRGGMRLVLQNPDGAQHEMDVMAKFTNTWKDFFKRQTEEKKVSVKRFHEINTDLIVWKMPTFSVEDKEIDEAMKKVLPFKALVLDLRGNGGGYERALLRLLGYVFDHDVKLGDIKRRKGTKTMVAKTRGEHVFKGRLIVLVDSNSASAAELFARAVQLERRGVVLGDHSSGKVMRSMIHGEAVTKGPPAAFTFTPFALNITDADITMTDGRSLEGAGVMPDELLLPTGADLFAKLDPALSRAAALAGIKLDPREAGALFPSQHDTAVDDKKEADDDDDNN